MNNETTERALYEQWLMENSLMGDDWNTKNIWLGGYRSALPQPSAEPVAWMCPNDPDAASAFKWAKPGVDYSGLSCDACGGKHVRVFATPPAADSAADARAKEAYDYRHLTQVAQGMGFDDIAGALTELVRLRGTADGEGI